MYTYTYTYVHTRMAASTHMCLNIKCILKKAKKHVLV